jgi:hypothetical protein
MSQEIYKFYNTDKITIEQVIDYYKFNCYENYDPK